MKPLLFCCGWLILGAPFACLRVAGQGSEVLVVYNTRVAESRGIAQHYADVRHVPANQVVGLDLVDNENMTRADFRERLQLPLIKILTDRKLTVFQPNSTAITNMAPRRDQSSVKESRVRYVVLCYGVPLRIAEDAGLNEPGAAKISGELRRNGAAVDSELSCLPYLAGNMPLTGPLQNPLYACTNAALLGPTNGLLLVARLDGPSAAIASALVDKAVEAETNGLWGRAYFDLRGLTNGPYQIGDEMMFRASEICRQLGFETIVDSNAWTFPASFPLSQVALYAGWYDENVSGPFARQTVEFMPGAFAYHLHSFSAQTLRSTTRNWVGPLLARGVTATMGSVDEPYLQALPDMSVFFNGFVHLGFSFGEAAYASQPAVSWQTTVVGDPLYRPLAKGLQQQADELSQRHSQLVEWAYLRLIDFQLAHGAALGTVINALDNLPFARQSPVLMEKLADLFAEQGRPSSSIFAWQQALKLKPTPQQRIRVSLNLAAQLVQQSREADAYAVYQQFLKDAPDYPDQVTIYRELVRLARKLDHKDDAEKYQRDVDRLTPAH